jgi:hypothetical protein
MGGFLVSVLKQICGIDHNGTNRCIIVDDAGHLVTVPLAMEEVHEGNVFSIQKYFGETADNTTIEVLREVGSTNDQHILDFAITMQGVWELFVYRDPEFTAAGAMAMLPIDMNMFTDNTSDGTITRSPTIVSTTVDASSAAGQKVLNVTATTNFVIGGWVTIDFGEVGTENNEQAEVASIQAGVSLTMVSNLANTYTNEAVEATGQVFMDMHTEGGTRQNADEAGAGTANWIFKSGADYLMRLTNRSDAAARGSLKVSWIEHAKQT